MAQQASTEGVSAELLIIDREPATAKDDWSERIEKALAARRAGQQLRKGKRPGLSTIQRTKL